MNHRAIGLSSLINVICVAMFVSATAPEPLSVSPGAIDHVTGVEVRCPTFSWQAVPEAVGYEVVVYQLPPETELVGWSLDGAEEAFFVELPTGVTAWTPPLEQGLAPEGLHVWFVRGVIDADENEDRATTSWSSARFFRVGGTSGEPGVTRVYRGGGGHSEARGDRLHETSPRQTDRFGQREIRKARTKDVGTGAAAIRGEMPDPSGETYGVVGISNSSSGAGFGAVNTAGGPDLVLDGAQDGETDTLLSQDGLVRSSPGIETFTVENTGGGQMHLQVTGTIHGNGSGLLDVDAETLDGIDSSAFSPASHLHDDRYFTEAELSTSGSSAVHWDNLQTVPPGLDDGDNDTTYSAGEGLELSGTEFAIKGSGYQNVVVVAMSGGDFTSVQAAVDSITDAAADNPYLVWVAPGVYDEEVTLTPHVHLQGAGEAVTVIVGSVGLHISSVGTLVMADDTSVRDLTVESEGPEPYHTALAVPDGASPTFVFGVTARSVGTGSSNKAVFLGLNANVTMRNVTAYSRYATSKNDGIVVDGARAAIAGGYAQGIGGNFAKGIAVMNYGRLTATDLSGNATAASTSNDAIHVTLTGEARLVRGSFNASHGVAANGICVLLGGIVEATGVVAEASSASGDNVGVKGYVNAVITLSGGSFAADGGDQATGIRVTGTSATLEADWVTASGHNGSMSSDGIYVGGDAAATLRGGAFTGEGGGIARGAYVSGTGSEVMGTGVTLRGELGSANSSLTQLSGTVSLGVTQVDGVISKSGGTLTCFQVFDASFSPVVCP